MATSTQTRKRVRAVGEQKQYWVTGERYSKQVLRLIHRIRGGGIAIDLCNRSTLRSARQHRLIYPFLAQNGTLALTNKGEWLCDATLDIVPELLLNSPIPIERGELDVSI